MIHFTPTRGIKETAQNANNFIKDNMENFWTVFKPYIPYIIAFTVLDVFVTQYFMPINLETGEHYEFPLGGFAAAYFYTCLAITWHRIVIHGADHYEPMNPFKPKRSELAFIGMGIALFIAFFLVGFLLGFGAAIINRVLILLIFPFVIYAIYVWTKVMFYFPAKATGQHISLKQSYTMTRGYVWPMIGASFLAYLKLFLITIAYSIAGMIVLTGLGFAASKIGIDDKVASVILQSLFMIPLVAFFQPLFTIIWVTILSNYYQYVLQHEALPTHD